MLKGTRAVEIRQLEPPIYLVSTLETASRAKNKVLKEGLVIHAYGSNKEEILGLAVGLVLRQDLKLLVFDLPGHGRNENLLTLANCLQSLKRAKALLNKPTFFVGHSLGGYLGLMAGLPLGVLISAPGKAIFESSRQDLLRTLRTKRVHESTPYAGLNEILATKVKPVSNMLLLRAENELKSVVDSMANWESLGFETKKVSGSNHLDIVSSHVAAEVISLWLKENLS
ncbi:MAG TPA: alpha/beta hydrolase [Candidatus Subteraquimicrobiales bacterium]